MGIEVPIEFIASFDNALKSLNKFGSSVDKSVGDIQNKFDGFKTILELVGVAFVADKIVEGIGEVISESAAAEVATNRLSLALKASGDYSQQNVSAFKDLAEQLSRTSRFDDDAILSQVALAKQFNTTNREAAKLLSAAVDLAAATGEDLPQAVQQLGQTLEGTAGRIGRLVPSIRQLTAEQLRNGDALDIVAKRFKGFSEGELTTFNGSLAQASKAFHDLLKAIGEPIVTDKGIQQIVQATTDSIQDFVTIVKANQGAIATFVRDGILILVNSFGILVEIVATAVNLLDRVKNDLIVDAQVIASVKTAISDPIAAFAELKAAINDYKENSKSTEATKKVFDDVAQSAANLSVKIEQINSKNKELGKTVETVGKTFDNQTNSAIRFDQTLIEKIQSLKTELAKVGETPIQALQNQFDISVKLIDDAYKNHILKNQSEGDKLLHELKIKYINEEIKIQQDAYAKLAQQIQEVYQNPFSRVLKPGEIPKRGGSLGVSDETQQNIGRGAGIANNILQGAAGASNLLGSAITSVATAFLGPVGSVLGPLAQQLAKGPEAVRQMVDDFARALPDLITNLAKGAVAFAVEIVKQIPTIINGLIDDLPDIIQALVEAAPDIIAALVEAVPRIVTAIVTKLPSALVKSIGKIFSDAAGGFIGKIFQGAVQFVGKLIEGAGKFISELISQISGGVGSKSGLFGTGLFSFHGGGFGLGGNQGLLGGGILPGILEQVSGRSIQGLSADRPIETVRAASGPRTIEVPIKIGNSQFARAIIDVKRLGYRLEPI
jgi:hypothetical protein